MNKVFAELNEAGDRCEIHFQYVESTKDLVKSVPGTKFVDRAHGGPHWQMPLDLASMRILREKFGKRLTLGEALKAWGRRAVADERKMHALAVADDCPPEELLIYKKLPRLVKGDKKLDWPGLRPYQRADIKFLAQTSAMNLLEPRLGKTTEMIGTIYEAGLEEGAHLVVAPQKTLDSVWRMEFGRFTTLPVFAWSGDTNGTDRAITIVGIERMFNAGEPFVFCTTADMIRRGLPDDLELYIKWKTFIIDEFHKTGLPEVKNAFPKKAANIQAYRKYILSGSPMGGKPIKLWGGLHFLYPERYTSKWRWADQWLNVDEKKITLRNKDTGSLETRKTKKIGGIDPEREEDFYRALAPHAIRRLRTEVLDQLPEKQYIDVWCEMSKTQRVQYDTFARDTEIRIDEYHLSATSVLAEYTRLKQFSNSRCEVEFISMDEETGKVELRVKPTFDSGKLPYLMERLAEAGIDPDEPEGTAQAIVTSQFRETAEMIYNYLTEKGIPCIKLTGKSSKKESELAQKAFKHKNDSLGLRVCVMVTTLGVGITMDNVETVHVMDETWVPDDQDQLSDRAVNTNTNHQVTVFTYRSKKSIEEYIGEVTFEKDLTNKAVLDEWRKKYRKKVRA